METSDETNVEPKGELMSTDKPAEIREQVRARYASAALSVLHGTATSCCADSCCSDDGSAHWSGSGLYGADDRSALPADAVAASLGCGNPVAVADLHPGETVLD